MTTRPRTRYRRRLEEDDYNERRDFKQAAGSSLGALPWWITSTVVHAVLLLLAMLIVLGGKLVAEVSEDVPHARIVEKPPKKEKPIIRHKVKSKSQVNIEAEAERPFYTPEKLEVTENTEYETENEERSEFPAKGHQDAVSTIPAEGTGTIGFMGVGSGGSAGAFGWRTGGGRKRRAMRFGGSQASEQAVDLGLEWLKWHQEPEGDWDRLKYGGTVDEGGDPDNVGMTGLAMLAFLGAGHTEKHGTYKAVVQRAIAWMITNQKNTGRWGDRPKEMMYRNVIGTMALSEAAGMGQVPRTIAAAQKAVEGIVATQRPYEAWGYYPFNPKNEAAHTNDTSVTIWGAMALKSAKVGGLKVPGTAFEGVIKWVDHAQQLSDAQPGDYAYKGGRCGYRGKMNGPVKMGHPKENVLTAAAGVIRLFWGQKADHPGIVGPANILLDEKLPGTGEPSYYCWYYATLLMFQKGGEHWDRWNKAMQPYLLSKQLKGDPKENGGSWDPVGFEMPIGGRVFSTALAILSLEVYYRYLPMYETKD